jgi:hypothetical protein
LSAGDKPSDVFLKPWFSTKAGGIWSIFPVSLPAMLSLFSVTPLLPTLNTLPDNQQNTKKHQQWAIGNVNKVNKRIPITQSCFNPVPVKYGGYPEDNTYHEPE